MAQVKIYGLKSVLPANRERLSAADFIYPADRSEAYTIIEISIFEGRSAAAKKALIHLLFSNIEQ